MKDTNYLQKICCYKTVILNTIISKQQDSRPDIISTCCVQVIVELLVSNLVGLVIDG